MSAFECHVQRLYIFPLFLPQTEYAISRACLCGCHFRTLLQQLPTSTKVSNHIPLLSNLVLLSLIYLQLFLSSSPLIQTIIGSHHTCECRHVFIDRLIQQEVNRPGHYHSYQLHIDQSVTGLEGFCITMKDMLVVRLKKTKQTAF